MTGFDADRRLLEEVDAEVKAAGALLTVAAAAKRAGVRAKTIRRWFHDGKLHGMQSKTNRIRIPERALSAFIAAR